MTWFRVLALMLLATPAAVADTPPEEEEAINAIRPVVSNLQKNRDGTVRFVRFSRPSVTDEHLAHLKAFSQVDYLAVITPTITDAGLAHIAGLTNLDTLFVAGTQLTDEGMAALANLEMLERLYLDRTQVGDAGLVHLAGLTELNTLSLMGTQVTGDGLAQLKALAGLETLRLRDTQVTAAGLNHLAGLVKIKCLDLASTKVAGEELASLVRPLEMLETLDLSNTPVTSEDLHALTGHDSLRQLLLYDTSVSASELVDLRAGLPKTTIHISPAENERESKLSSFLASRRTISPEKVAEAHAADANADRPSETAILPPVEEQLTASDEPPDFQRHVIPMLGRLGCNGRNCHGSFQGRGGFRLSMFGYDFAADREELAGDGVRVNVDSPEESLILLKPTLQEDHEGGQRYEKDGWEYQLLLKWIQSGAPGVADEAPQFERLDVTPTEIVFDKTGQSSQLQVVAVWSDGAREDVTALTRFQTGDDTVAEVTAEGLIRAMGPGGTYVISFYDNGIFSTEVVLPVSKQSGDAYPDTPAPTKIDELVARKLSKLGIVPSQLCSDEEFLRRVGLDLIGTLPTPDEVRQFLDDPSPDKRLRKIDELLQRPAYVAWWTNLLCDLTGCNAQFLGTTDMNQPAAGQWQAWIRRRVQDNVGWDKIAAGILLAASRRPGQTYEEYAAEQSTFLRRDNPADYTALDNPMHYYWFRSNLVRAEDRALSFGYLFLGVRLDCAQCHKHPFDQWSKQDFEQFTEFFTRIKTGAAPDAREAQNQLKTRLGVPKKLDTAALRRQMYMRVAAEGKPIPWNEIYIDPPGKAPQIGKLLGGREIDLGDYDDPREPLTEWLTSRDNPYFARAFVNRIWAHYFHVGIVDPPDDMNLANPPSNKPLLDYLAGEFAARGYDMKWLHRTIASSRTYQLSWRPNDTNRGDERNFSRAVIRRLPAEVVIDAIIQATANDETLNRLASTDVVSRKIAQHPKSIQARGIDYSLLVFGKPLRTTNCDCEREMQPSLLQSLYVRNDQEILDWIRGKDGWVAEVARGLDEQAAPQASENTPQHPPDSDAGPQIESSFLEDLITKAYLRTLSRFPSDREVNRARQHFSESSDPVEGLRDLMWALLNTQEFLTNH